MPLHQASPMHTFHAAFSFTPASPQSLVYSLESALLRDMPYLISQSALLDGRTFPSSHRQ